ncbi:hypothetical protein [Roseovarius sp. SYSU LYC5161]|uniref:hypothetical protein n=1 Tax=Roseovarius halophilus (ex Wu et al. 2025) TaxID=3376060 RepID=UPI00399BF946
MSDESLRSLAHESCNLACMIEGLAVLADAADWPEECPLAKRARNALPTLIDAIIEQAWALNNRLDRADMAELTTREK